MFKDQSSSSETSSSPPQCAFASSIAPEAVGLLPVLGDWNKEPPEVDLQPDCTDCYESDQLRKQFGDLYNQYQTLCAAYNQSRREVDSQFQEIQSLSLAFNIEKSNRVDAEIRCQALKNDLNTAEGKRTETNGQQMAIIAKLTDILHASPTAAKVTPSHPQ